MTLYSIGPGGIGYMPRDLLIELDTTLSKGDPSFQNKVSLTVAGFRQLFLGEQDHAYDYLLESGMEFNVVTPPPSNVFLSR